jgi:ABC-type antimicrobial peptide transport system ATPase subunit
VVPILTSLLLRVSCVFFSRSAHRLNTILDSQKIVVMAAGKVAEVGSPAELLARPPCDLSVDPGATFGLFAMMANSKKAAE